MILALGHGENGGKYIDGDGRGGVERPRSPALVAITIPYTHNGPLLIARACTVGCQWRVGARLDW